MWYNNGTGGFGIGTNAPDYKLTVNGTIKAYDAGNNVMGLFSPLYGNYLHIGAWDTTGSTQKNIVLNQFGAKVGICTNTPAYTLDVLGDIGLSGNLYTTSIQNNTGILSVNTSNGLKLTDLATGGSGTFTIDASNHLYWNGTLIA